MTELFLFPDFADFLNAFNKHKVRYLLVGGYSVILHGYVRSTMDMDIWVERTESNYRRIVKAFQDFMMQVFDMSQANFLRNDELDVFSFGRPPVCIDVINKLKDVMFKDAWKHSDIRELDGISIRVIGKKHLIQAKKAAGRHKDLDDIEHLESA